MIPLFKEEDLKGLKSEDLLPVKCKNCKCKFHIRKKDVSRARNPNANFTGDFCSRKCLGKYKKKISNVVCTCKNCNKEFTRTISNVGKNVFCSRTCSTTYNNSKYPKRKLTNKCEFCKNLCESSKKFCSRKCINKNAEYRFSLWVKGDNDVLTEYTSRSGLIQGTFRKLFFIIRGNKCENCNWTYVDSTNRLPPLEIHHKDSNHKNNNFKNLKLLCPNCHAVFHRKFPIENGKGRKSAAKPLS